MGAFEIWGQTPEENEAHGDSYSVNETLLIEAPDAGHAVEKFVKEAIAAVASGAEPEDIMPAPANGDHWHFKVLDAMDRDTEPQEFAVRLTMVPQLQIHALAPARGEDSSI